MVLCVARTFLSPLIRRRATDPLSVSLSKLYILFSFSAPATDYSTLGSAYESHDFITKKRSFALFLHILESLRNVSALHIKQPVGFLNLGNLLIGEIAATKTYDIDSGERYRLARGQTLRRYVLI